MCWYWCFLRFWVVVLKFWFVFSLFFARRRCRRVRVCFWTTIMCCCVCFLVFFFMCVILFVYKIYYCICEIWFFCIVFWLMVFSSFAVRVSRFFLRSEIVLTASLLLLFLFCCNCLRMWFLFWCWIYFILFLLFCMVFVLVFVLVRRTTGVARILRFLRSAINFFRLVFWRILFIDGCDICLFFFWGNVWLFWWLLFVFDCVCLCCVLCVVCCCCCVLIWFWFDLMFDLIWFDVCVGCFVIVIDWFDCDVFDVCVCVCVMLCVVLVLLLDGDCGVVFKIWVFFFFNMYRFFLWWFVICWLIVWLIVFVVCVVDGDVIVMCEMCVDWWLWMLIEWMCCVCVWCLNDVVWVLCVCICVILCDDWLWLRCVCLVIKFWCLWCLVWWCVGWWWWWWLWMRLSMGWCCCGMSGCMMGCFWVMIMWVCDEGIRCIRRCARRVIRWIRLCIEIWLVWCIWRWKWRCWWRKLRWGMGWMIWGRCLIDRGSWATGYRRRTRTRRGRDLWIMVCICWIYCWWWRWDMMGLIMCLCCCLGIGNCWWGWRCRGGCIIIRIFSGGLSRCRRC